MKPLPQAAAFNRMQQLMSSSLFPSMSTELLTAADGELNPARHLAGRAGFEPEVTGPNGTVRRCCLRFAAGETLS